MKYKWINNYTGAIYTTLWEAIKGSLEDIKYFPKCRTIKIFDIRRFEEV